jgi:hypothetical protein
VFEEQSTSVVWSAVFAYFQASKPSDHTSISSSPSSSAKLNTKLLKTYQKKKVVGLERGALSLVSSTEELLDRKVAAAVYKT